MFKKTTVVNTGCGVLALMAILLLSSALCHGAERPVIVNVGEATVLTLPGQVEFRFVRHFTADTLEDSVEQCDTFLRAATQAIRGAELQPTEIRTMPPLIISMPQRQTQASFSVRFSMAVFNTPRTGPKQFGALYDKLAQLAETMKCTLSAPRLIAADEEAVMAAAITRATENAYPSAEAVALAVKSSIYAVDTVEILAVEWQQVPEKQTAETPQIACRAQVRVTYALAPGQ